MSDELTGVWYGRYDGSNHQQTNSFIAQLDEAGNRIGGVITEPDPKEAGGIRRATVSGARSGASIDFVKQYDGRTLEHAVFYQGSVNADATEISGSWTILYLRGTFVMTREKFSEEELEEWDDIELEALR